MKLHYGDIIERIETQPLWWDPYGVPRYCEFHPDACPNLYADEVVLLKVACQSCKKQFSVAYEWDSRMTELAQPSVDIQAISYGEPPHNKCCLTGPSMTSIPLHTIQFWARNKRHAWVRRPELENVEIDLMMDDRHPVFR
jgi:hypothetical protein